MALQPTMDAPKFKGTAVVNGQFKEISLDDYRGGCWLMLSEIDRTVKILARQIKHPHHYKVW